jgi:predicted XRE-type DNA-binding protein
MSTEHVTPAGGNIFEELNIPDAENEKLRLHLIAAIKEWVSCSGLSQTEAATAMGVKQPTLNDALKGRFRKFTIDRLVRMLSRVGKRVDVTVTDKAA